MWRYPLGQPVPARRWFHCARSSLQGTRECPRLCFCDETVCHPTGHIGADANDCSPASGKSFFLGRIGGTGVGDIHGDKTVGAREKAPTTAPPPLVSSRLLPIRYRSTSKGVSRSSSAARRRVTKPARSSNALLLTRRPRRARKGSLGHNKGSHQSFPLFLGQSGVNIQIRQWSAPVGVACLLNMGGQDSHKTNWGGWERMVTSRLGMHPEGLPHQQGESGESRLWRR